MDCALKPSQRTDMQRRRNKGKRGPEENGGGPLTEPEEGPPHSYSSSCWNNSRNKRRRIEVSSAEPQSLFMLSVSCWVLNVNQIVMFTFL